jgi:hypothetical protein
MKKHRRQSDVGAHVENAIAVAKFNAMLHVAPLRENLTVNEAGFIRVQRKHRQSIGKHQLARHALADYCPRNEAIQVWAEACWLASWRRLRQ